MVTPDQNGSRIEFVVPLKWLPIEVAVMSTNI